MKTYLITGGSGLIGQTIVTTICEENIDDVTKIVVLDLHKTDSNYRSLKKKCSDAGIKFEFIRCDLTSRDHVMAAMRDDDVSVVIHTAAVIDFRGTTPDHVLWRVNVEGTKNILEACRAHHVQYLVYTSSIEAIYPNENCDPFVNGSEDTPYNGKPLGQYGKTKLAAENLVTSFNGEELSNGKKLHTCALRLAGIYGEGETVFRTILRKDFRSKTLRDLSSAPTTRMYKENAAWAHVIAACKLQKIPNVIGGQAYFIKDDTPSGTYSETNLAFLKHRGFQLSKKYPPYWLIFIITWFLTLTYKILALFGSKKEPLLTTHTLKFVYCHFTVSDAKFVRHCDYRPRYDWPTCAERMMHYVDRFVAEENLDN